MLVKRILSILVLVAMVTSGIAIIGTANDLPPVSATRDLHTRAPCINISGYLTEKPGNTPLVNWGVSLAGPGFNNTHTNTSGGYTLNLDGNTGGRYSMMLTPPGSVTSKLECYLILEADGVYWYNTSLEPVFPLVNTLTVNAFDHTDSSVINSFNVVSTVRDPWGIRHISFSMTSGGTATISLPNGSVDLSISSTGYNMFYYGLALPGTTNIDVYMDPVATGPAESATYTGTLLADDGLGRGTEPVFNASIELTGCTYSDPMIHFSNYTTSDDTGKYSMNLPPGSYSVSYRTGSSPDTVSTPDMETGLYFNTTGTVTRDITFDKVPLVKITGTITETGHASNKLANCIIDVQQDDWTNSTTTDANGTFEIWLQPGGSFWNIDAPSGYYDKNNVAFQVPASGVVHDITLDSRPMPSHVVSGHITDSVTSRGIPGVSIFVMGDTLNTSYTDMNGDFSLNVTPGDYSASITRNHYYNAPGQVFSITATRATTATLNLAMTPYFPDHVWVNGTVSSMSGPLPLSSVSFSGTTNKGLSLSDSFPTDNSGKYYAYVPRGSYHISARGPIGTNNYAISSVDLNITSNSIRDFTLSDMASTSNAIYGFLIDDDTGVTIPDTEISFHVPSTGDKTIIENIPTDGTGFFRKYTMDGDTTIHVDLPGYKPYVSDSIHMASSNRLYNVRLSRMGTENNSVSGTIYDENSSPVSAVIELYDIDNDMSLANSTEGTTFDFGCYDGNFNLSATGNGGLTAWVHFKISNASSRVINISLIPTANITGYVSGSNGSRALMSGVEVLLKNTANETIGTSTSNDSALYSFMGIDVGTYMVSVDEQPLWWGYLSGDLVLDRFNDIIQNITLLAKPTPPPFVNISGNVRYADGPLDGQLAMGSTVTLLNGSTTENTTTVDAWGNYNLTGVRTLAYLCINITPPTEMAATVGTTPGYMSFQTDEFMLGENGTFDINLDYWEFPAGGMVNVSWTLPAVNATDVAIDARLRIAFDHEINNDSFGPAFSMTPAPGNLTYTWSTNGKIVTIGHDDLAYNTEYTINLSTGLNATDGAPFFGEYAFAFTTGGVPALEPEIWIPLQKEELDLNGAVEIDITTAVYTTTEIEYNTTHNQSVIVYHFSGTCGENVTIVHIYNGFQTNDDTFVYMPLMDMETLDFITIVPDNGSWELDETNYTTPFEKREYVAPPDPGNVTVTDTYHYWIAAVGWTPDAYGMDEMEYDPLGGGEDGGDGASVEPAWWASVQDDDIEGQEHFDTTVHVSFNSCVLTVQSVDNGDGTSTATTSYSFEGTCDAEVSVIHIYTGFQTNDDAFTYTPFMDPDSFTHLEIPVTSGSWSWSYSTSVTYPTPNATGGTSGSNGTTPTDTYHTWFMAVGWAPTGFGHDEREVDTTGSDGGDGGDGSDGSSLNFGLGSALCGSGCCVVLFLIVIIIIIVVVVVKKKKGAKGEDAGEAVEEGEKEEETGAGEGEEGELPPPEDGDEEELPSPEDVDEEELPSPEDGDEEDIPAPDEDEDSFEVEDGDTEEEEESIDIEDDDDDDMFDIDEDEIPPPDE